MEKVSETPPPLWQRWAIPIVGGLGAIAVAAVVLWLVSGGMDRLAAPPVPIGTIEITVTEYAYVPSLITVPEPGAYTVTLVNHGRLDHNISFDDRTTIIAPTGGQGSAVVVIPASGTSFECTVPYHSEEGLVGVISTGK